jgi:hypothetical protein
MVEVHTLTDEAVAVEQKEECGSNFHRATRSRNASPFALLCSAKDTPLNDGIVGAVVRALAEPEVRIGSEQSVKQTINALDTVHNTAKGRNVILRMFERGQRRGDIMVNRLSFNVCFDNGFAQRAKAAGLRGIGLRPPQP